MSQRIGASKSKPKHPLIGYMLHIMGVVLMQENNYFSSLTTFPFTVFVVVVFRSYLTFSF